MPEIHLMAGHLIRRLNQISVSVFQDRMAAEGLDLTSVQFAALAMLEQNPGIDQTTLAGLIAHDRATMGGVIDRLAAKGLLRRQVSPSDRRARVLSLTAEGKTLLMRILPVVEALQRDILVGLTPAEQATFLRLAARAAEAGNELSRAPMKTLAD